MSPFSEQPGIRHVDLEQRPLPYADGVADVILISHGLCLRPKKRDILAEFARILRKGGWLRIDDNPDRFWVGNRDNARRNDPNRAAFAEELLCPRPQLLAWLDELGFDAEEIDPRTTQIPLKGKLRKAVLGNRQFHESFTVEAVKR